MFVKSTLRPAALSRRGVALFIDLSVLGCGGLVLVVPIVVALTTLCFAGGLCTVGRSGAGLGAVAIATSLILPAAYFLFSWWRPGKGQSVGMRAVGIRVVQLAGSPPTLSQALVRATVLVAVLAPGGLSELAGLHVLALAQIQLLGVVVLVASILVSRERRGIHDHLAGTMLVSDPVTLPEATTARRAGDTRAAGDVASGCRPLPTDE